MTHFNHLIAAERVALITFAKLEAAFARMCSARIGTPANRRATEEYARAYDEYQAADARFNCAKCAANGRRHLHLLMSVDIDTGNQSPTHQRGSQR